MDKLNKKFLNELSENYFDFILKFNSIKNSSCKNFYIIISNENQENLEENIFQELNEKYFKIKECLSRCGNFVFDVSKKEDTERILFSFFNSRKELNII